MALEREVIREPVDQGDVGLSRIAGTWIGVSVLGPAVGCGALELGVPVAEGRGEPVFGR